MREGIHTYIGTDVGGTNECKKERKDTPRDKICCCMLVRSTLWPLQHGVVVCSGNSWWKWKVEWFAIYKYCIHYSTRKKEKNAFDKTTTTTLFLIDIVWRSERPKTQNTDCGKVYQVLHCVYVGLICEDGSFCWGISRLFTLTMDFRIPWTGQVFGGVFVCLFSSFCDRCLYCSNRMWSFRTSQSSS